MHVEGAAADGGPLAHHGQAVVPFGAWSLGVEPGPVVLQHELDVVPEIVDVDPHVGRMRMLEGIHHAFPSDVVHEERDGGREGHL